MSNLILMAVTKVFTILCSKIYVFICIHIIQYLDIIPLLQLYYLTENVCPSLLAKGGLKRMYQRLCTLSTCFGNTTHLEIPQSAPGAMWG